MNTNTLISAFLTVPSKTFILCYHRIIPSRTAKEQMIHRSLYVTPASFEAHIRWILNHAEIVGTDRLYSRSARTKFVFTFDDGWKDAFAYATPILEKYDCIGEFFVCSGNIDNRQLYWTENLGKLIAKALEKNRMDFVAKCLFALIHEINDGKLLPNSVNVHPYLPGIYYLMDKYIERAKYMQESDRHQTILALCKKLNIPYQNDGDKWLLNWQEIASMARKGHKFGSHTQNHILLDRVDNRTIDAELVKSKTALEAKLDTEISSFSYPNGFYSNPYVQVSLQKHGYKYAFTLEKKCFKRQNRFLIPRFLVFEDVSDSISGFLFKNIIKHPFVKAQESVSRIWRECNLNKSDSRPLVRRYWSPHK